MGRIMAVDYGQKRIGLAVTDPLKIIANALTTVASDKALTFIEDYIGSNEVECIVVGDPLRMDDTPSQIAPLADKFAEGLKKKFPNINIVRFDERYTSKMAFQTMIDAGLKKKARRNKELIDSISAVIILQSYMESKNFSKI